MNKRLLLLLLSNFNNKEKVELIYYKQEFVIKVLSFSSMNAIIILCHFCEIHGPKVVFCTQVFRNTKLKRNSHTEPQKKDQQNCPGCYPIGLTHVLYSTDQESGATCVSSPLPVLSEMKTLVKQAAVRSLSCEISSNKDGGYVYFGDATRGHTLSHTFRLFDTKARGFYQLFSIIILMKDKYTLINLKPFLAEHLRKTSNDLQKYAKNHQDKPSPEGYHLSKQSYFSIVDSQFLLQKPRSLIDLTGMGDIYARIHSNFTWILLSGSHYLSENATFHNLSWLSLQKPNHYLTNKNGTMQWEDYFFNNYPNECDGTASESILSLRYVKQILGADQFPKICYCVLTGVKVIIHGKITETLRLMLCLKQLIPSTMHHLIKINANLEHLYKAEYKIMSIPQEVNVPKFSSSICSIDFMEHSSVNNNEIILQWSGTMPTKWPDLLLKLLKATEEIQFTDIVLRNRIRVLVEEWKNKAISMLSAKSQTSQAKLKKIMGIQPQDDPLIHYWSTYAIK